ncbi:DNA methyltransferase family protein [Nocardioides kribbensis]|uniref:methylase n=1 Tax=Nocardioides kribbensis TaxID=305517 RepID=UPI001879A826|nr:methylase [Nocardioides kribbensis]
MTLTEEIIEVLVVKPRNRVKAYGEVFTPRHMVDRMLDLVRAELEAAPNFVDKTFLEPAAGDGNFLVAILHRKLRALTVHYPPEAWPTESLFALASIYGVELLEDNHADARNAMLEEFESFHAGHEIPCDLSTDLMRAATFLVETNIVRGNMLSGFLVDEDGSEAGQALITFSWWNRVDGKPGMVQRETFTLESLRKQAQGREDLFDLFNVGQENPYLSCPIDQVHKETTR